MIKKVMGTLKTKAIEVKDKVVSFVERKKIVATTLLLTSLTPGIANATAEAKWNTAINFMLPWIQRLGGVVMLVGAIEWGLAFKDDDAAGKVRGLRTIIAGAMVFAIGLSASVFLV